MSGRPKITGLIKISGLIQQLKQMRAGDNHAGAIAGGTLGTLGGTAAGLHGMTRTLGGLKDMAAANQLATATNKMSPVLKVLGKRVVPWALVLGALGTLAGGKIQDEIRKR